jgi:hypothetical protein
MSPARAEWGRFSDFLTQRQLADTPLYHDFYRRVDVHHQLSILLYPSERAVWLALALNRDVRDFSDRERLLPNLLRLRQARRRDVHGRGPHLPGGGRRGGVSRVGTPRLLLQLVRVSGPARRLVLGAA